MFRRYQGSKENEATEIQFSQSQLSESDLLLKGGQNMENMGRVVTAALSLRAHMYVNSHI